MTLSFVMSFFSFTTILFAILFIVFGSFIVTAFTGAPWVPTGKRTVRSMLEVANVGAGDVVFDLGSGDGRIIFEAARRGAKAIGVDINPFWILWCRMMSFFYGLQDSVKFLHGNFFDHDISKASVVTMYLLQETNERIQNKLVSELEIGARVVSCVFTFPGWTPVHEDKKTDIRLYVIGRSNQD